MNNLERIVKVCEEMSLDEDVNREIFEELEDAFLASRGQKIEGLKRSLLAIKASMAKFVEQKKMDDFKSQLDDVMDTIVEKHIEKDQNRKKAKEEFMDFLMKNDALDAAAFAAVAA